MSKLLHLPALTLLIIGLAVHADEPPPAPAGIVVLDSAGKELPLAQWQISFGTRKVLFAGGKTALAFRELNSTTFAEGIQTLIPMDRVRSVSWDYEKQIASVLVAGVDAPVTGTTRFKNVNVIQIEAEIKVDTLVAAIRVAGGVPKNGIKEVRFPSVKAGEKVEPKGELWSMRVPGDGKSSTTTVQSFRNPKVIYRIDGTEKLLTTLAFRKTLQIDLKDIKHLSVGEIHVKEKTAECEVTRTDGTTLSLTLLPTLQVDGKTATLVGILGEVPHGWRVIPIHAFTEIQPGEMKDAEPKEIPKKSPPKKKEPEKKEPEKKEPEKKEPEKKEPEKKATPPSQS